MELDDFKSAWQALDQRLERQHALNSQLFRETRLDKMRRGLRTLAWGQAIQILIGVGGSLLFAPFWIAHLHEPSLLISGLIMHVYCLGLIVFGTVIQVQITHVGHSAPIVSIQHRLLQLRRTYAIYGTVLLGLPWWFLYIPLLIVLAGMSGINLIQATPSFVRISLAIGVVGTVASIGFYHWAHRPGRKRLGRRIESIMVGASIRRAQRLLDELGEFEQG